MQENLLDQMEDIGYENHNAIQNLGSLAIMVIILIIRITVVLAIGAIGHHFQNQRLIKIYMT